MRGGDAEPLISVVTPSFNHGRFIADAIESVLGQAEPRVEHIVVDGGSIDDTEAVLARFPHLSVIRGQDAGQSDALNRGFEAARAPVVCWLNADDFLLDGAFAAATETFSRSGSSAAVVGHYYVVDAEGAFLRSMRTPPFDRAINRHYGVVVPTSGAFYSRSIFARTGVRLDLDYNVVMDWDLYQQLADRHIPVLHTGAFLSAFRVHDGNKSIAGPDTDPDRAQAISDERRAERERFRRDHGYTAGPDWLRRAASTTSFHVQHARLVARKAVRGYYSANRRDLRRAPRVVPAGRA